MFFGKKGPHLALLAGCTFYGMTGIFLARIHNMPDSAIIFYRLFFGTLLIGTFALLTKRGHEIKPKKKKPLLIYGGLVVANMFFYFICVRQTCVSISILLEYTAPIYVLLASPFVLGEKIGKESLVALIIAITGVCLVLRPEGGFETLELTGGYVKGIASGLLAGLLLAAIIMYARVLKRAYSEFAIAFWGNGIACLLMAPFAFDVPAFTLTSNLPALAVFGFVSVGLGGILTTTGFANLESQTGSLLALIEPVSSVLIDLLVLGVALSSGTLLGCFLVLISSTLVSLRQEPGRKGKGGNLPPSYASAEEPEGPDTAPGLLAGFSR